jgi:sugar (pentulose or hexulose) kinase
VLLPLDFTLEDDALLPESGVSNTTHLLCRLTRKKMEALCLNELLALLRPLREVAIAGGALLPGDADPALVQAALELEEAEKQDFPDFYPDESSLSDSLKQAKKAQQKGRKKAHSVAKDQRKFRAEKGRLPQRDQKVQNGIHGRPIARVVLVGGTTRMPVVGRLIAAVTGVVPQRTVNPDEAVALGCAVHVGVLDGDERMGTVLNPMQAAILRALAQRDGIVEDDFDEDFEMESQEFEAFKTFES